MKYLLVLAAVVSPVGMATQMEGFGANYDQDDSYIANYDTNKGLAPEVIIGDSIFVMEFSRLSDIAKTTGVAVNQSEQASWLCLAAKGIDYWFISDNEMGQGDLTSVAIATSRQYKGCSHYNGDVSVTIKGVPLLNASPENLSSTFSNNPDGNIIQYCADTKTYGDFTQLNCLQYFFENKNVKGVFISQVTSS